MSTAPAIRRATAERPCPVCRGDHKCSFTADGLILCGRGRGPVPGFTCLGPCEKDPQWTLYRESTEPPLPPKPAVAAMAEAFARNMTAERAADLASRLGLPVHGVNALPLLGFDPRENCFTFPERDALGIVRGLVRRFPDGTKRAVAGSHRGVSVPGSWIDEPGPLFLVEGPTDVMALAAAGLCGLGRPSNRGGVPFLLALLKNVPAGRTIVIVGENDRKPDGEWPGRDGAKSVAESLAMKLGRPVLLTMPPPEYKDVRAWISDRWQGSAEGFDWTRLGQEVSRDLVEHAATIEPLSKGATQATAGGTVLPRRKFPLPVPLEDLELPGPGGVKWVWDGFLARDAVTLFSALPKCGKTTLLAHLLAALPKGGAFCGRSLAPGRAVVVSEEPAGVWAARRDEIAIPKESVRVIARNAMPRCSNLEDWAEFLGFLAELLETDPADVVIFDTLANLWPVKDENSAAEVGAALSHFHRITSGRAVLAVHHLRKSDGAEGTGSRGSGALAGFADIILELRRQKAAYDPSQRKRVLSGYGRYDAIPAEWVVELGDGGRFEHRPEGGLTAGQVRSEGLKDAIRKLLEQAGPTGLTRKEIWERLPDELRRNEKAFTAEMESGVNAAWRKQERKNRNGGPLYLLGV